MFKKPFPPAAVIWVERRMEEPNRILAWQIWEYFGYECSESGISKLKRRIRKKNESNLKIISSSAGCVSG